MSEYVPKCDRCGRFTTEPEQYDGNVPDPWNGPRTSRLCANCDATQRSPDDGGLTERDLYDMPPLSLVLRSWPNSPGPDMPEVYQKKGGGWWLELTDRNNDYEQSTGVIWSDHARFTLIYRSEWR